MNGKRLAGTGRDVDEVNRRVKHGPIGDRDKGALAQKCGIERGEGMLGHLRIAADVMPDKIRFIKQSL